MSGWIKPLPTDRSKPQQLMRPVFLMQFIFAGYMCLSSIFYFLNTLGYYDFHKLDFFFKPNPALLDLVVRCQQYYCLGHAALVTGIFLAMNYPVQKKYNISNKKTTDLLLYFALVAMPVSYIFDKVNGLQQFAYQFNTLCFMAGTLSLAKAIPLRRFTNIILSLIIYGYSFYVALLSGFKEPIIISLLVLGIFLYPEYKKTVTLIFVPLLLIVLLLLPTYNRIFRQSAWSENVSAENATRIAFDETFHGSSEESNNNWDFLVYRLSEIDMLVTYLKTTPKNIPFYGSTMIRQSADAILPRFLWPTKPVTERLVMQRVYDADISSPEINVSAKPALIADAYLFSGGTGIFFVLLLYGMLAQLIAQKAESLFGGYLFGVALIYSGLFQFFWRGLSFEFLANSLFWSYVSMLLIARILYFLRILQKAS